MKMIEIPQFEKSSGTQAKVLERLSPIWLDRQKVPPMTSSSLTRRLRAGVYMRYSTDQQDPYSFTRQLENAKAYAEAINVDIVKIYGDPGASGAYTANRPAFNEMLEDAEQHKFDILIVEEGDRLSRKLHITTAAFSTLAQYGVEIHSTKHGKWSLIHAAFSGLLSDEQRTRITELMLSGRIKVLSRGLWPSRAPFGFEKIPGQPGDMRHREDQAVTVKRIFAMRLAGIHRNQIADILAREGIPAPTKYWNPTIIQRILANPLYVGILLFFRTRQKTVQVDANTMKILSKMRPADEWRYSERPDWALIDLADWRRVQELEPKKREYGPLPSYLLSRMVYCGECGRRMHFSGTSNYTARLRCTGQLRVRYYAEKIPRCPAPTFLTNDVEEEVIRFVCNRLDTPDALKQMQLAYGEKTREQAAVMNRERAKLEAERDAILKRLDATFEAAMTAGLTTEVVRNQRANYCVRIEAIDGRLASLPQISVVKAAFMEVPPDSASFLSELTPMRNYRGCSESLARLMATFRKLVGRMVVRRDRSTNETIVQVEGPISHVGGNMFRFKPTTRIPGDVRRANNIARKNVYSLHDDVWAKIQNAFPVEPIWMEEFDKPIDFRKVLDAIIFLKKTKVGMARMPDLFGPKRQVWAAARMLNYAGIVDEVEGVIRRESPAIIDGIGLSLDSLRSKKPDPWTRFLDWNRRRKERVLARLATQQATE
jgi:site-specific DNA recombinase